MAFKRTKELKVKFGTYQKDGETKNSYRMVGSLMEDEDGKKFILIDPTFNFSAINRGDKDMVIVSMFDPKPKETSGYATETPNSEDVSWDK